MFMSLNPGAIRLSIPFAEALTLAHTSGFPGLDLSFPEIYHLVQETSLQTLKERFQAAGVRPGGWGLPVDFRGDEMLYQAGLAALPAYAEIAQALDSPWCITWILPFSDEKDYESNMEFHVSRLRPIAHILAEHGCRLGLEFVGPETFRAGHMYEFIYNIAGSLELGRRIDTGNTGLLLDCWHWYTSRATVEDITALSASQVVYVHVNDAPGGLAIEQQIDSKRLLPGASGIINISGFLQALTQIGYEGPVVVEPFDAKLFALAAPERVQATKISLDKIWLQAGLRAS